MFEKIRGRVKRSLSVWAVDNKPTLYLTLENGEEYAAFYCPIRVDRGEEIEITLCLSEGALGAYICVETMKVFDADGVVLTEWERKLWGVPIPQL